MMVPSCEFRAWKNTKLASSYINNVDFSFPDQSVSPLVHIRLVYEQHENVNPDELFIDYSIFQNFLEPI